YHSFLKSTRPNPACPAPRPASGRRPCNGTQHRATPAVILKGRESRTSRGHVPRVRPALPAFEPCSGAAEQAEQADDDEIERDDVVEDARKYQDQDARDERDDRLNDQNLHEPPLLR